MVVTPDQAERVIANTRIQPSRTFSTFATEDEAVNYIKWCKAYSKAASKKRRTSTAPSLPGTGGFPGEEFDPELFKSPMLWLRCCSLDEWVPYFVCTASERINITAEWAAQYPLTPNQRFRLVEQVRRARTDYHVWRAANNNQDPLGEDNYQHDQPIVQIAEPEVPFALPDPKDSLDEPLWSDPASLSTPPAATDPSTVGVVADELQTAVLSSPPSPTLLVAEPDDDDKESIISLGSDIDPPLPPQKSPVSDELQTAVLSSLQSPTLPKPPASTSSMTADAYQRAEEGYDQSSGSDSEPEAKKPRIKKAKMVRATLPPNPTHPISRHARQAAVLPSGSAPLSQILHQAPSFDSTVQEVVKLYENAGPDMFRTADRELRAERLLKVIKECFRNNVDGELGGSTRKGIYTADSDADLYFHFISGRDQPWDRVGIRQLLRRLVKHLTNSRRDLKWLGWIETRPIQAQVPVIQVEIKGGKGHLPLKMDVCLELPQWRDVRRQMWDSELAAIKKAGQKEVEFIVPLVKMYLQYYGRASGAQGGLTGTCLLALVIHRLLMLGDVLRVQAQKRLSHQKFMVVLLLDFLNYYATVFDSRAVITYGDPTVQCTKEEKGWTQDKLCITHPNLPDINIAKVVHQWSSVKAVFLKFSAETRAHLRTGAHVVPPQLWERYILPGEAYPTLDRDLSVQEVQQANVAMQKRNGHWVERGSSWSSGTSTAATDDWGADDWGTGTSGGSSAWD